MICYGYCHVLNRSNVKKIEFFLHTTVIKIVSKAKIKFSGISSYALLQPTINGFRNISTITSLVDQQI